MRKLIVAEHLSLDGVMQAPGGPKEDPSGGFRFGGWEVPYSDDAIGDYIQDMFARPFELLLGRCTYDIWAAYWPKYKAGAPASDIADKFNATAKHVATHRAATLDWKNSHALTGPVADAVRALKEKSGADLLTWGSADLVRQLLAAGLVDELRLMIYPVVLGPGKRLFGDNAQPSSFALTSSVTTPSGVLLTRYTRAGDVRTGTYEEVE